MLACKRPGCTMTISDDEELSTLLQEVQRLLGRCMLRLQQYEQLIKAMVAYYRLSGSIHDLEETRAKQIDHTARMTLGNLVGDFLGSYVVAGEIDPAEETKSNSPSDVNRFAMQISLSLPDAEFVRVERELKEMVLLRNNLVHHFIDQHDLGSSDGCRGAKDALVNAYNCIDQHFGQLREWAEVMEKTRQALAELSQSERFQDDLVNGIAPDRKVNWDASGIVSALREAFRALAVDGWAPVAEAGKWVTKLYPEQLPAKWMPKLAAGRA